MKLSALLPLLAFCSASSLRADPQLSSWMTTCAGKYARIYTSDANKLAGTSANTWTNGAQNQATPAYCGVQEISYSANWIYLRTTGLASHIMGPWYLNAAHTQTFPNLAVNQRALYRIPRSSALGRAPATKILTGLGVIGYFVEGYATVIPSTAPTATAAPSILTAASAAWSAATSCATARAARITSPPPAPPFPPGPSAFTPSPPLKRDLP